MVGFSSLNCESIARRLGRRRFPPGSAQSGPPPAAVLQAEELTGQVQRVGGRGGGGARAAALRTVEALPSTPL